MSRPPADLAGWIRLASTRGHQASGYSALLSGQAAIEQLAGLDEAQAKQLISVCAATLSLYPAWERHTWMMPEPELPLATHKGCFFRLAACAMWRVGTVTCTRRAAWRLPFTNRSWEASPCC